ncbi:MAG: formate--phosphoribosylaminoimidazolecarboxamide ligase [Nitrososphaerota archaeon]
MDRLSLAVYASHSAIQILLGAREEGLLTTIFGPPESLRLYSRFPGLVNKALEYSGVDCLSILKDEGHVLIPSGSIVEYVGYDAIVKSCIPYFGLKELIKWESEWDLKLKLLNEAGIPIPKTFKDPSQVDTIVIVKLPGAKGGKDFFISKTPREIEINLEKLKENGKIKSFKDVCIQEYVVGTTMYAHYFYSPIFDRLEITGFDIRYETNVDGMKRLPPALTENIQPSFIVCGNIPVYPREKLLETFIEYGERFVKTTKRLIPPGIIGPFCLECVINEDLEPIVFEFSGRIVAGTNIYMNGSPYLKLYWGTEMSVGRRIAKEIRIAKDTERLTEILT